MWTTSGDVQPSARCSTQSLEGGIFLGLEAVVCLSVVEGAGGRAQFARGVSEPVVMEQVQVEGWVAVPVSAPIGTVPCSTVLGPLGFAVHYSELSW